MTSLGERLRELRLAAGLSQRRLAGKVDVGFPHISKIEAGLETPSTDLLRRLAEVLGVSGDELLLLADRVPDEMRLQAQSRPDLAVQFFRKWRTGEISDDDVRNMIEGDRP